MTNFYNPDSVQRQLFFPFDIKIGYADFQNYAARKFAEGALYYLLSGC
jgi:hypothetical protein